MAARGAGGACAGQGTAAWGVGAAAGVTEVTAGAVGGALRRWTDTGWATDRADGGEAIGTTGRGRAGAGAGTVVPVCAEKGAGEGLRRGTAVVRGRTGVLAGMLAGVVPGSGRLGASGRVEASGRADRRCTVAGAVARGRSVTVTRGTDVTGAVGIGEAGERCATGATAAAVVGMAGTGAGTGAVGGAGVAGGAGSAGRGGVAGLTGCPTVG
ncbi:hypothetical protein DEJ46_01980 [Streptomyces venezuelae]|uniref:Uncharacterized protein n=1 Tax=Streptomyces venezuelae TaxID=54571 RepID=A0A5P2ANV6_STRVZ|nr:hypothetical protein DEJ46_01980 [Streptomyces venezuelae]